MRMIEIIALDNGAHRNQTYNGVLPDGWVIIPDDMETPNFPFGEVEVEEIIHYREVTKVREVETVNEDGETVIVYEEYTEQEPDYIERVVVKWTPLPIPEPEPQPEPEPTTEEILNAMLGVS